jgi:hypothetical protein
MMMMMIISPSQNQIGLKETKPRRRSNDERKAKTKIKTWTSTMATKKTKKL